TRRGRRLADRDVALRPLRARGTTGPVHAGLHGGRDHRGQIAAAPRARKPRGIRARDPADPVRVLALLTGHGMLATAEEQDRLPREVPKIDLAGGAGHRDPSLAAQL